MKTKTILTIFAALMFALLTVNLASAYYGSTFDPYYGRGSYDSNVYYSQRTSGDFYGYRQTTTTASGRVSEKYWEGNDWVDRTTYVRETRESPEYSTRGSPRNYYNNYYNTYPSYRNYNYDYGRTYNGDYGYSPRYGNSYGYGNRYGY